MQASSMLSMTVMILAPSLILSLSAPAHVYAELQLLSTTESLSLDGAQNNLEVRLTSNQSAISIQSVMISLNNSGADASLSISGISVYDQLENRYYLQTQQSAPHPNGTNLMLDNQMLPLAIPAGWSLAIDADVINPQQGGSLEVSTVYIASNQGDVSITLAPLTGMPFDVVANHDSIQIQGNATDEDLVEIDNGFVDPEIHCESCTRVEFQPSTFSQVDVTFVSNGTDLSSSDTMTFWVMGRGDVVFNIAGSNQGGNISYARNLEVSLDDEWRRIEIDLSGEKLDAVTHLFGFTVDGMTDQTFYLKGMSYN